MRISTEQQPGRCSHREIDREPAAACNRTANAKSAGARTRGPCLLGASLGDKMIVLPSSRRIPVFSAPPPGQVILGVGFRRHGLWQLSLDVGCEKQGLQ
jgi:hypothetical protein